MSAAGKVRRRPAGVIALAIVLATVGDSTNAEAAQRDAKDESAIESARSDYEAISDVKAGRTPSQLPLPKQAMPRLDLKSDALPAPPNRAYRKNGDGSAARGEPPDKSENWLIEAMNQTDAEPSKATDVSPDKAVEIETPKGDLVATAAALERAELAAAKAREAREEKDDEIPAFNPLAAYMAGWLSTRDIARTDTAMAAPVALGSGKRGGVASFDHSPAQRDGALGLSVADAFSSISERPGSPAVGAPAANPYLLGDSFRGWNDGASPAPLAVIPANPAPLLRSPDTISREPAPAMESKTPPPLSEQLRPQDDAKYFKQLKRF